MKYCEVFNVIMCAHVCVVFVCVCVCVCVCAVATGLPLTFPQLTTLELQCVSPKLLECRDLELAVPGTYNPASQTVSIQQVVPALQVITSKQRPRKLRICGGCPQHLTGGGRVAS